MSKTRRSLISSVLLLVSAIVLSAPAAIPRQFILPQHGRLLLSIPSNWQVQVRQPKRNLPLTIRLSMHQGKTSEVFITPLWKVPGATADVSSLKNIRKLVESGRAKIAAQAVERNIKLKSLDGNNRGFYYGATDRAPKPGEYKYLIQGAAAVGGLVTMFTVLSNDKNASVNALALDIVRSAMHRPENFHTKTQ